MPHFNTIADVQKALKEGHKVCWQTPDYVVGVDLLGQWYVAYRPWSKNPNYVGLFYIDGVTTDYNPEDFYIAEKE